MMEPAVLLYYTLKFVNNLTTVPRKTLIFNTLNGATIYSVNIDTTAVKKPLKFWGILTSLLLVTLLLISGYFSWQTRELTLEAQIQTDEIVTLTKKLQLANQKNLATEEEIQNLSDEYEELRADYRDERNKNEDFEDRIDDLAGTIGNLDKLVKTDKQLLQKYSKVFFLNENYIPESLEEIDRKYILSGRNDQHFHGRAIVFLENLLKDAARDDIDLKVVSAYRSFDEQAQLKGQFTQIYGTGANAFSADQGYSEHQLGTAVDLTINAVGGTFASFADTEAFAWLEDNAHKHGFILSYPQGNRFYVFEPWHWRFVGENLARDLHRDRVGFYDVEQREIDTYLISLFD